MSTVRTLYIGNTNALELAALRNQVTGEVANAATVTCTLKDTAGNAVAGETWPLAMAYVPGSEGLYRCYLVSTLPLTPEARYVAEVTATVSGSLIGKWLLDVVAKTRK
jgi:hypothetical protein